MADHRDPGWWQSIAERWQAAVAAWGLLAAGVGGLSYKGVRWWRRIRRAAREGDSERPPPPPPPRYDTPMNLDTEAGILRLVERLGAQAHAAERRCDALDLRLRESERNSAERIRALEEQHAERMRQLEREHASETAELRAELEATRRENRALLSEVANLRRRCGSGDHRPV